MTERNPGTSQDVPVGSLVAYLLITFGIAWGLLGLYLLLPGAATASEGQSVGSMLGAMAFMLVLGPVEEFGWRGVALPLLQRRLAPFWAALLLGAVWGVWHLPAFLLSGTPQSGWSFTPFLVGSVCLSVIVTPLFNAAGGSILLAVLYHFQVNNPLWPDAQPYDTVVLVFARQPWWG